MQQDKNIRKKRYEHLDLVFEPECQMVWAKLKYPGRPCMSRELLADVADAQRMIATRAASGYQQGISTRLMYQVLCSDLSGVFSLGGDLAHFIELIRNKNRTGLFNYAKTCVDILYKTATSYDLPFTTIALVQGETLGGGFEAALSANTIIAERGARFGFPETVFGLFPGMGAFSFLARRLAPGLAKRLIASGKVYTAEELHAMGVVDVLVPDGKGREAVYDYIHHQRSRSTGFHGLDQIIDEYHPLSYKELMDVATLWVETAMKLSEKNIRLMQYLLRGQDRRWNAEESEVPALMAV